MGAAKAGAGRAARRGSRLAARQLRTGIGIGVHAVGVGHDSGLRIRCCGDEYQPMPSGGTISVA